MTEGIPRSVLRTDGVRVDMSTADLYDNVLETMGRQDLEDEIMRRIGDIPTTDLRRVYQFIDKLTPTEHTSKDKDDEYPENRVQIGES